MSTNERRIHVEINKIKLASALAGLGLPRSINQGSAKVLIRCVSLRSPLICIEAGDRYEVVANAQTFQLAIQAKVKRLRICVVDASEADALIADELVCHPVMDYLQKPTDFGDRYRLATKLGLQGQLSTFGEAFRNQKNLVAALGIKSKNTVFKKIKGRPSPEPSTQTVTNDQATGDHISLSGSDNA